MDLPKIYLWCESCNLLKKGKLIGVAMSEGGVKLVSIIFEGGAQSLDNTGLTSKKNAKIYKNHYPSGYRLVWITKKGAAMNEGFQRACLLNKQIEKFNKKIKNKGENKKYGIGN